ncbi:MAG: hypothetical protein MR821_08120 [Clostridiales bacterium]|nr:hypothetical protein [Clostridiales bacterium]
MVYSSCYSGQKAPEKYADSGKSAFPPPMGHIIQHFVSIHKGFIITLLQVYDDYFSPYEAESQANCIFAFTANLFSSIMDDDDAGGHVLRLQMSTNGQPDRR